MIFGSLVHRYDRIASTNDAAREAAVHGVPEGAAFIADEQASGRGRLGRAWHSPSGKGLYVSFILRPSQETHPLIPLAGGLAVHRAVFEATQIRTTLKWPNDILYRGAKLGGILAEAVFSGSDIQYAVLGIGLNVEQAAEDFPPDLTGRAMSLRMMAGAAPSREDMFFGICRSLDDLYGRMTRGRGEDIVRDFQAEMSVTPGAEIRLSTPDGEIAGIYRGLTARGEMIVYGNDENRILYSAEIVSGDA